MIKTPWTHELQDDDRLGFGIREASGELIAVGMTMQDARAACAAVNRAFPPGSAQCKSPGMIEPGYSKPYEPDPRKPHIA